MYYSDGMENVSGTSESLEVVTLIYSKARTKNSQRLWWL